MSNDSQAINQKGLVYIAHQFKQVQILKVLPTSTFCKSKNVEISNVDGFFHFDKKVLQKILILYYFGQNQNVLELGTLEIIGE